MTKNIMLSFLNENKKVFVDLYEQHVLLQVTKDNINIVQVVDLTDDSLELTNETKEMKLSYFNQQMYFSNSFTTEQVNRRLHHRDEMINMLTSHDVCQIYHIDCEADVYVVD